MPKQVRTLNNGSGGNRVRSLIKAILILPFNVLVVIPSLLIWWSWDTRFGPSPLDWKQWLFWVGLTLAGGGLTLMVWTVRDFMTVGQGTPAPWDPPRHLVVKGPYRHVRNPMISGVIFTLCAESLILQSVLVAGWAALFITLNLFYIPLSEEKGLEQRFGQDYLEYKRNVPRWLPRLTPWNLRTKRNDLY